MEAYQAQKIKTEITEDDTAMLYDWELFRNIS
jgi:hypothetical protein